MTKNKQQYLDLNVPGWLRVEAYKGNSFTAAFRVWAENEDKARTIVANETQECLQGSGFNHMDVMAHEELHPAPLEGVFSHLVMIEFVELGHSPAASEHSVQRNINETLLSV